MKDDWKGTMFRQMLIGKSRYRFLEPGVIKAYCSDCDKHILKCNCIN